MVLDDLDRELLRLLLEDARLSFRRLAEETGSTVPTVASRVRRMEELGIIEGYSVRLDPSRFGAKRAAEVDLGAEATVACHLCGQETASPHWATLDGRRHPFCCTTCRTTFVEKHHRLAEGL